MHSGEYSIESLILDPHFIRWIKNPSTEDGSKWMQWASQSPDNQHLLDEARELVTGFSKDDDTPVGDELSELWCRILATNAANDLDLKPVRRQSLKLIRYSIAAVIAFFMISAGIYFATRPIRQETEYGSSKTIILPDSSVIVLNAHSSIRYASKWGPDKPREVWLSGEGFFSVIHKYNSQQFVVHTHDLDIRVLGTKFNVNTLRERTRVILNSGKVKLYLANGGKKVVEMKPGELVDFSISAKILHKKTVKAENYSAWVYNKLVFDETPLREIANILEDNYGYKVTFTDPEMADMDFTGTVDSDNVDLLLTILQKTFNISISKQEGEIIISK